MLSITASGCGATTGSVTELKTGADPLSGPFTTSSVGAAEKVLAQSGIATVADESSKTPLVALAGSLRMTFTAAQVHSMALQAANRDGIPGMTLDAAMNLPSDDPPFSYLLAAWVSKTDTPGATAVRELMGAQDWSQAPTVVFPTIALPLFSADVAANMVPSSGSTSATTSAITSPRTENRGPVLDGIISAPCSTVANFIQDTLNTVFNALMLGAPTGASVVSKIGRFFVNLWNNALSLAQAVVQKVLAKIGSIALQAIGKVAAVAVVVAQIAAYLLPWSVRITPPSQSVNAGDSGTLRASVETGTGAVQYPAAVIDCANGASLPSLTGADAPALWSLSGPISPSGPTSVTLDDSGSNTLTFTTSPPPSGECASTQESTAPAQASISVTRRGISGLENLVSAMLTTGLGAVGSIASPIVSSLLGPILAQIQAQLIPLATVVGSAAVTVVYQPSTGAGCPSSNTAPNGNGSGGGGSGTLTLTCPSVGLVASVLGPSYYLGSGQEILQLPGMLSCLYVTGGNPPQCPPQWTTGRCYRVIVGLATYTGSAAASLAYPGQVATSTSDCDCEAAAYYTSNTPPEFYITTESAKDGLDVTVQYRDDVGVDPYDGETVAAKVFDSYGLH
jgi:hypothetical protein